MKAGLRPLGAALAACVGICACLVFRPGNDRPPQAAAAWHNIGGCGSSGGGAAAGAGKWVGRGVSGGLVDLELLSNHTLGGDYFYTAEALSGTFHYPRWPRWTASLALAWNLKLFEYEGYKVNDDFTPRQMRITGGFGDMGLGLNHLFGEANEHSFGLSGSLPTGQHDIKRLHIKSGFSSVEGDDMRWMSPFWQPGSGLYNLGLSYEYTKTKDWGLYVFGGSYSAAFAWDNWGCRDDFQADTSSLSQADPEDAKVRSCQEASPSPLTWKLWELVHQGGDDPKRWSESKGAPGTGATGADVFSLYAYVGRKEEASTQSLGLTLSVPTGPTYYWEYGPSTGSNSRMTQRIRTYDLTMKLSFSLEVTNPDFPVFLSLGVPYRLPDIAERGRLVNPMNYVGTLGIRGTFF